MDSPVRRKTRAGTMTLSLSRRRLITQAVGHWHCSAQLIHPQKETFGNYGIESGSQWRPPRPAALARNTPGEEHLLPGRPVTVVTVMVTLW